MFGNCLGNMTELAKEAQEKAQENKRKLDENFHQGCCSLCLDDICSDPAHNTGHITVDGLIKRVTRYGDTEGEKYLTIYLNGKNILELRDKEMDMQFKIMDNLEKLLKSGEDKFNLGGGFNVCYTVYPEPDRDSGRKQNPYELPFRGIYQISQGKLIIQCDSSAMAFREHK